MKRLNYALRNPQLDHGAKPCQHCIRSRQADFASHPRRGVSLLEVVISVAIFLASLTAILSLLDMGNQSRLSVQLDANAAILCESAMGEYLSGYRDLTSTSDEPLETADPDDTWLLTTTVEAADGESLLKVTVLVSHVINGSQVNSSFLLTRLIRDPQLFIDAASSSTGDDEE